MMPARLAAEERLDEPLGLLVLHLARHGRLVGVDGHVDQRRARVVQRLGDGGFEVSHLVDACPSAPHACAQGAKSSRFSKRTPNSG